MPTTPSFLERHEKLLLRAWCGRGMLTPKSLQRRQRLARLFKSSPRYIRICCAVMPHPPNRLQKTVINFTRTVGWWPFSPRLTIVGSSTTRVPLCPSTITLCATSRSCVLPRTRIELHDVNVVLPRTCTGLCCFFVGGVVNKVLHTANISHTIL